MSTLLQYGVGAKGEWCSVLCEVAPDRSSGKFHIPLTGRVQHCPIKCTKTPLGAGVSSILARVQRLRTRAGSTDSAPDSTSAQNLQKHHHEDLAQLTARCRTQNGLLPSLPFHHVWPRSRAVAVLTSLFASTHCAPSVGHEWLNH